VEFTNRGDRAINVFIRLTEFRDKERADLILGVGSICDAPTAAMYIAAGADFIVGPVLDEDTAVLCNSRKIPYSPGCGSLTEIHKAHKLGVEICKIFPGAEVGGPSFVRAIKSPCPWAEIMPTGGVSPTKDNLSEWFEAGAACVGMGSKLITKELVAAKDYAGITKKVKETIEIIKAVRAAQQR
jgi:2-dehydro-3-deoxyphosphogluconate aldolase/(4S)-4-hydroxy-2-oxoglutarate aldolase